MKKHNPLAHALESTGCAYRKLRMGGRGVVIIVSLWGVNLCLVDTFDAATARMLRHGYYPQQAMRNRHTGLGELAKGEWVAMPYYR